MTTIIQITDFHLFKDDQKEIFSIKSNEKFYEVMSAVKKEKPDYFFLTGDLSEDETPESYQKIVECIDAFGIPAYWIPGNHDDISIMQNVFAASKQIRYADHISFPDWDCVFLNTKLDGSACGKLADAELSKLDRLLKKSDANNIAVIMHHHPIKVSTPLIDQFILQNPHEFLEIIDKYQNIKLIMCGHVHGDYAIHREQITVESSPATCLQWKKGAQELEIDKTIGYKKYQFNQNHYDSEAIIWR